MNMPRIVDVGGLEAPLAVVGDCHLEAAQPALVEAFVGACQRWHGSLGTLVILGDLFDAWVGGAQARDAWVVRLLDALAALARSGTRVVFQPGNRDYLFRGTRQFRPEPWPDVVLATCAGRRLLFTHGDLLCSEDRSYLRMRRFLRWAPSRWVARALPGGLRRRIAGGLRGASGKKAKRRGVPIAAVAGGLDLALAGAWMDAARAEHFIVGHVHTGARHDLPGSPSSSAPAGSRVVLVLRDWQTRPEVLWLAESGDEPIAMPLALSR